MSMNCQALKVAFAGTPEFAAVALDALLASDHTVVGVLTQPDRRAGRGRQLQASPVKRRALEAGIAVQQPLTLKDEDAVAALAALEPDVLVVAAYGLLLPAAVLSLPPLGCLNIHGSLLPRWRGAAPIQRAVLAGDPTTGVCIMQMDEGLDTGAVLLKARLDIHENHTSGDVHDALASLGAGSLLQALTGRCDGSLVAQDQADAGVSYAHKLDKAEARIDFNAPALSVHRAIQAFNPWPVAETHWGGERLRLWRSRRVPQDADTTAALAADVVPGQVLGVTADAVRVATADGALDLTELQRPGKRVLPAHEFAQGLSLPGQVFGPGHD